MRWQPDHCGVADADLSGQAPTKFELLINMKAAKVLGLTRVFHAAHTRRQGDRKSLATAESSNAA